MTFSHSSDENLEIVPQASVVNDVKSVTKQVKAKKNYECTFCHERFRNKDSFDRHVYHHTNEKKYKCSFVGCLSSFTNVAHLRRHNKRAHTDIPLQHSVMCLDLNCPLMFTSDDNMRRHYKQIHQEGNKYVCNTCGQSFHRKSQLKRHNIIHTGDYPYRCEKCGKGAVNLKAHIRHRASHVHDCDICGRVFKHWTGLVAHKKIGHVLEFKCETCNKVFVSKKNLNYHQKVHENPEKRDVFQCPYEKCAKFYTEKRNLMAHIRSKHEGRKFICEECSQQISTKQKLELHLKLHLSEKMGAKSRPGSRRNSVDSVRKVRKDKGKKKVSAVSDLTGIIPAVEVEKALLNDEGDGVIVPESILPQFINSSDVSDIETKIN